MKKILAAIVILALTMALGVPVFAEPSYEEDLNPAVYSLEGSAGPETDADTVFENETKTAGEEEPEEKELSGEQAAGVEKNSEVIKNSEDVKQTEETGNTEDTENIENTEDTEDKNRTIDAETVVNPAGEGNAAAEGDPESDINSEDTSISEYVLTRAELSVESLTYTGAALTKAAVLVFGSVTEEGATSEVQLSENTDFTIAYKNNVNAGKAKLIINGIGDYKGQTLTETFEIAPAAITSAEIKYQSLTYTGKPKTQSKMTEVYCQRTQLVRNKDFKIKYENNILPGTATMKIRGIGNYTGMRTKTFAIRAKLSSVTLKYDSLKYTGKARTQSKSAVVEAEINGESVTLTKGTDYKITYKNNVNAGTAVMRVTGIGNYKGTITKKFSIEPVKITSAELSAKEKWYTGKALKSGATVKAKVNGKKITLRKGKDYTVSYKNNKNVGKATVTIKGKGNFTGTLKKTFSIILIKVSGTGNKRVVTLSSAPEYNDARVAVWTKKAGQDDLIWYDMKRNAKGFWKATVRLADMKDYGKVFAHVYSGQSFLGEKTFKVSHDDWLKARSDDFKHKFLHGSNSYVNIDYVQCAINIANNDKYGYGHSWRRNAHTLSCAGLVGLTLTYCGYGDFIKDDPVEQWPDEHNERQRWGYLDLGTYSGKYNWVDIMINEVGAVWHPGTDGIEPGDILYHDNGINNNHCGIYIGGPDNATTIEARGPYGQNDYDENGDEVAIYPSGTRTVPWQGYFRIPNKHYY